MTLPSSFPTARHLARDDAPTLRWGVIGVGHIATQFVPAVQRFTNQRISAVAARSLDRADAFARTHGIATAVGSAQELVDLADVDAVYVAARDDAHVELGLMAIAAGKHVLIEKPIAPTAAEAKILTDAGRAAGVMVMEAMWTRYLPQFDVIRQLVADGVLGEVRFILASACRALLPATPPDDLTLSATAGMGVYPIAMAYDFLGEPTRVQALGQATPAGGDVTASIQLEHRSGALSSLTTSAASRAPVTATISGTEARVDLEEFFFNPTSFTLVTPEKIGASMRWQEPTGMTLYDGLAWQVMALARYAGEGRYESPLHTHEETLSILSTIDEARAQITASA